MLYSCNFRISIHYLWIIWRNKIIIINSNVRMLPIAKVIKVRLLGSLDFFFNTRNHNKWKTERSGQCWNMITDTWGVGHPPFDIERKWKILNDLVLTNAFFFSFLCFDVWFILFLLIFCLSKFKNHVSRLIHKRQLKSAIYKNRP